MYEGKKKRKLYMKRVQNVWFIRPPGIWHGMKYIRCISPLWQPLTYFLPFVLPYNSSENIINYARKSRGRQTGWTDQRGRE